MQIRGTGWQPVGGQSGQDACPAVVADGQSEPIGRCVTLGGLVNYETGW